jgi:CHASE3 domain sensor protein
MNTEKIEYLLEQLLGKQDELIQRIENLESTIGFGLTNINTEVSEVASSSKSIYEELIWWGEGHSLAKQVLQGLTSIENAIGDVETQIMISSN